ncbi:MAG: tetratricopeptide repeat protein [Candidatus Hodarchaeales archaeon]|jgi:tetratricopeptide (TPR) repeat protein
MFPKEILQKEEQLLKGQYGDILKNYVNDQTSVENLWIVLEAYFELNMLNQAEELINQFMNQHDNGENYQILLYFQAFLLKEKAELNKAIDILTDKISKTQLKSNAIIYLKHLLLLIEVNIILGDLETTEESLNYLSNLIHKIEIDLYKMYFSSERLFLLGNYMLKLGDYERALNYFNEALQIRQKIGNPSKMATNLITIGEIYSHKGQLLIATDYFKQALDFWEKVGNLDIIALAYINLGRIQSHNGNFEISNDYFQNGLEFVHQSKNPILLSELIIELMKNKIETDEDTDFKDLIKLFPHDQLHISLINAYHEVIKALIAQKSKNWGSAKISWHKAIINEGIRFEHQLLAHEALAELAYMDWLINPKIDELLLLEDRLDAWEMLCMEEKILQLSKIYLLRAKLALSSPSKFDIVNIDVARQQLNTALMYAEQVGIDKVKLKITNEILYVDQLEKELNKLLTREEQEVKKEEIDFEKYLDRLKQEFKSRDL